MSLLDVLQEKVDLLIEKKKRKLDPSAKVRNRPSPIFPADSKSVKDDKDHFPVSSIAQARNALARAGQFDSTPSWYSGKLSTLKSKIKSAVKRKYPSIEVSKD